MPSRMIVARELADIFKTIAHADRIRLIEELAGGEQDVNTLAEILDLPKSRVSQHLGLMRAHRLVEERREGRHHYYHLCHPNIASWILEGIAFIETQQTAVSDKQIKSALKLWSQKSQSSAKA